MSKLHAVLKFPGEKQLWSKAYSLCLCVCLDILNELLAFIFSTMGKEGGVYLVVIPMSLVYFKSLYSVSAMYRLK